MQLMYDWIFVWMNQTKVKLYLNKNEDTEDLMHGWTKINGLVYMYK